MAGTFEVKVDSYKSRSPGIKSILIMPPTGGRTVIDRMYATILCKAGFDVYILKHWTGDSEYSLDLSIHQRLYEKAQQAIGKVVADIQSPFIGILGTSVGAIHAATAMGIHKRLNSAFLIVGGAPLANVIAESDQAVLVHGKKKRMQTFKFKSTKEYIKALDKTITLDPAKVPALYKGKYLGMVISTADTMVPAAEQEYLRKLWKPQVVHTLSRGHVLSIVQTALMHRNDIVSFFETAVTWKGSK